MSKKSRFTSILFLVETIQGKQFRCIYRQKKKNFLFFFFFFCIFQIYIKFWTFPKKGEAHSLRISEITNPEKRV